MASISFSPKRFWAVGVFLIVTAFPAILQAQVPIRHELKVILQPESNKLEVEDTINLPESLLIASKRKLHFRLRDGFQPVSPTAGVTLNQETNPKRSEKNPAPEQAQAPTEQYILSLPPHQRVIVIRYQGRIEPPINSAQPADDSGPDAGVISQEGIFLTGTTQWYPQFNDDPVTFSLDVDLPEPWEAVSQGERLRHERGHGRIETRWESSQPQEEIILIGGRFIEYSRTAGDVEVMAFLRTPDEQLANRYLEAGRSDLEMYEKLIGPYLYKKLALVENFWETGYGLPSMTLLGSTVLRLPFILDSSYPHEILHNWWGNGVFVDDAKGNWSEGLTTYMADYLIQEQRGTASEYRRTALQKYADYVTEHKDFPLTEFRARHSPATEAIGYSKAMMFFHMLRIRLGDAAFVNALRNFYREKQSRPATFDDLRVAFAAVAGEDLKNEFAQWIGQKGAPALSLSSAQAQVRGNGYLLTAIFEQTQAGPAYRLRVPITVTLEGREKAYQTSVKMDEKRAGLAVIVSGRPVRLDIDPEFDLFRRLSRDEIPPALSQSLGAEKALFVLPSDADEAVRQGYRQFAETLSTVLQASPSESFEIKLDREVSALPTDRAVWILGWENRFVPNLQKALTGRDLSLLQDGLQIRAAKVERKDHTIVLTARQPQDANAALTWVATDSMAALSGLGRKLPHYGPYSYLVFEGDEPKNILKGQWDVLNSPLSVFVKQPEGGVIPTPRAKLEPRRPLAERPEPPAAASDKHP
ncbi:MAG TPA: M1 family aminopeptidase [Nitrospiria bacterium]|nr:M1 family aminopeptidase [Nitrospiria bacterium]